MQSLKDESQDTQTWMTRWHWYSDWNGDEVGYDHLNVVGLYGIAENVMAYIDTETGAILEHWYDNEDEYAEGDDMFNYSDRAIELIERASVLLNTPCEYMAVLDVFEKLINELEAKQPK